MKPKLMAHPSQARTITSPEEQERLAAQGWVIAQAKTANRVRNADAATKRTERAAMRAAGYRQLQLWLSPEAAAVVDAVKQKGESYAAMLERLARLSLI